MPRDHDLVVPGDGTGGFVSAQIAASVGARIALIERARAGRGCPWTGCVPGSYL